MAGTAQRNVVSTIAIVLSVIATGATAYFANLQIRTDVLPTLVFVYIPDEGGWLVRNVGNGPALDPIVSHQNHASDAWLMPTRIYPLENGERVKLPWVGNSPDRIIVYYQDAYGNHYVSRVDDDRTSISFGDAQPLWPTLEEKRIWER